MSTKTKGKRGNAAGNKAKGATGRAVDPWKSIKVTDHNWGASFQGTFEQLKAAELVPDHMRKPKAGGESVSYRLPLRFSDGYDAHCYKGALPEMPQAWEASVMNDCGGHFAVSVRFDPRKDLNTADRTAAVITQICAVETELKILANKIAEIPPVPLSKKIPAVVAESRTWKDMKQPEREYKSHTERAQEKLEEFKKVFRNL